MQDLLGVPSLIKDLAAKFHQIRGDAAAQLPGNIAALRRKVEDEIHHHQRGKKGKRLEQIAEQLFQKQPEIFHKYKTPITFQIKTFLFSVFHVSCLSYHKKTERKVQKT